MDLHARKLLTDSLNDTIYDICYTCCHPPNDLGCCETRCLIFCPTFCPPDVPSATPSLHHHRNQPNKILITVLSILASTLALVSLFGLYVKFYLNPSRERRRRQAEEERNQTQEEFLDEEHGPVVDHPIWYIRTVGLQPSVISSITMFNYKKGEGLVEGTECSVCLNEFQEDETLRLLPKCSHAFHIPCIDTWLRSHTNCPMCRAPIIVNASRGVSLEGGISEVDARVGSHISFSENGGGSGGGSDDGEGELIGNGREELVEGEIEGEGVRRKLNEGEDGMQPIRRSASLDSLSAFKISMAMINVPMKESDQDSDAWSKLGEDKTREVVGLRRNGGKQRLLDLMASSSTLTSSAKLVQSESSSSSVMRSFSCSGKLFAARYSRNRNSTLPF